MHMPYHAYAMHHAQAMHPGYASMRPPRHVGTMGCLLHDNHAGPHQFSAPMGPRVRKPKIKGDNE